MASRARLPHCGLPCLSDTVLVRFPSLFTRCGVLLELVRVQHCVPASRESLPSPSCVRLEYTLDLAIKTIISLEFSFVLAVGRKKQMELVRVVLTSLWGVYGTITDLMTWCKDVRVKQTGWRRSLNRRFSACCGYKLFKTIESL